MAHANLPKFKFSVKHLQIDRAQATMAIAVGVATAFAVFALVSSYALLKQRSYQTKVIKVKSTALNQLKANVKATETLVASYTQFANSTQNVIGGNPKGTGPNDGDNPKIVLDSLPSKYDFPALATSVEKLLLDRKMQVNGITGSDDELNQQVNQSSPEPKPIEMPFQVSVNGTYTTIQDLFKIFENSIRPIHIISIDFTGSDQSLLVNVDAQTYYQPAKSFNVRIEEVR